MRTVIHTTETVYKFEHTDCMSVFVHISLRQVVFWLLGYNRVESVIDSIVPQ
jgi:hypothetical protein